MRYTSDKICDATNCRVGAEYTYKDRDFCVQHFRKALSTDYIAAHPECIRRATITLGTAKIKVTKAQLAAIKDIIAPTPTQE